MDIMRCLQPLLQNIPENPKTFQKHWSSEEAPFGFVTLCQCELLERNEENPVCPRR